MIREGVKVASVRAGTEEGSDRQAPKTMVWQVVIPSIGAAKHALKVASWGADAVIVQGGEGGGHTGPVATTLLLPSVIDALAQAGSICRSSPRWFLRRPRARRCIGLRCRRRRDGHPVPAHLRQCRP